MSVVAVLDGSTIHDSDVDLRSIAQLSAVGTLADEVLADLIKADAGILRTADSAAIRRASELFDNAISVAEGPVSLWAPTGLTDALRKMSAPAGSGHLSATTGDNNAWPRWLRRLSSALSSAADGNADRAELDQLRNDFTLIAASTMDSTQAALHNRLYSASWLTA